MAFDIFGLYRSRGNSSDIVLKSCVQICPFSSGVSTCFLSYSLESKGTCKGMTGSLGYLVSIKTGSVEELCDKILYTWECRENYTEQILPRVDEMKQYAYSAGFALSDLLAQ